MNTVLLHQMTSPEIGEFAAAGGAVIVPIGAHEQHGPHLPVQTDFFMAGTVAERAAVAAAERGVRVAVTPTLWAGYSPHHMNFPGTVTLRAETFLAVIVDVCTSLWSHGLHRILVLNGHGGNMNLLGSATQVLRFEHDVRIGVASYWQFALPELAAWRQSDLGGINHACEMEMSLMMAADPDHCHPDKAKDMPSPLKSKYFSSDLLAGGVVATAWDFAELSSEGTLGAPERASVERGEDLLNKIVSNVADFVGELATWDWSDPAAVAGGAS